MNPRPRRALARLGAVVAVGAALLALGAIPASAHIRVSADGGAAAGSYAQLAFRVPTEKDTASTTAVQIFLPADQPLASVSVQPHPGWTATVNKKTLAQPLQTDDGPVNQVVSDVVFTAQSPTTAIAPGQFDEFSLLVGPLPNAPSLAFPANQTYSDGSVVAWNESAAPGAPEPEHPSPSLTIGAAGSDEGAAATTSDSGSSSTPALVIGIIALVLSVVAIVLLGVALLRGRRT
ncbi:YcnI family protein [Actinomycetospora endophytica]|uniref:YcnI family protein n=1 Tax=Actinomycetospora endophytica TaxID=2291215 RepID=A0ABS8PDM0_9PSEU|nr:YcnI family protein [Actinomycetospora endophytica]MCD2195997.1 YcnI family protein [Actinomycetospora endophytica]